MTRNDIKLALNCGVELKPTLAVGISEAIRLNDDLRFALTWDWFNRLYRTAKAIEERLEADERILDVGGFDGALALFLPAHTVDVIDPITTGGSGLLIPEVAYSAVVAIDVLEHVNPEEREHFLSELVRVAKHHCFINFPAPRSLNAQQLVFELTANPLVEEHVTWALPVAADVTSYLQNSGFACETIEHTSVAQWVSQYNLQTYAPDIAAQTNSYLLNQHLEEPASLFLYDLVIGTRTKV